MRGRADAGAAEVERARLGGGERAERRDVVHRQRALHGEHERHAGDQRDGLKIRLGMVGQGLVQADIGRMGPDIAEQQRVAVAVRARDPRAAGGAAGARRVLDDHPCADLLAHGLRDDPRHGVAGSAGRKRHHDGDRPGREGGLGMTGVAHSSAAIATGSSLMKVLVVRSHLLLFTRYM